MASLVRIPTETIEHAILLIRGHKVILDEDLALLFGVPTKVFNQSVKRNLERFSDDFMFQLTVEENENLRSQFVTSSLSCFLGILPGLFHLRSQSVTSRSSSLPRPKAGT